MKKRYAVIAGIAIAAPIGGNLAMARSAQAGTVAASWATMDADGDAALSPEEVSGTPWEAKFDQMDGDGDNKVTKAEFKKYMQAMKQSQQQNKESNT